ncbi:MAG: peptide deformylase [Patescibacteria group bacterium]
MIDPIVVKGTPVLRKKSKEVPHELFGTTELKDIVRRMSASLRATEHGVAIAAPQIGIPYRLFVVRGFVIAEKLREDKDADKEKDLPFVNPKIVKRSRKKELVEEACLSVPGHAGIIKRSLQASVRAYGLEGTRFERGASGLLAQIFQHECDHLDGILYVDKADKVFEVKPKAHDEKEQKA